MTPLYTVSSLEGIALMFEARAQAEKGYAENAKSKRDQAVREANANTWQQAANMLRRTQIDDQGD